MDKACTLGFNMTPSSSQPLTLKAIQQLDQARFIAHLGGVVEHSPWVIEQAWHKRPFVSFAELFDALSAAIHAATHLDKIALLQVHPALAGREAVAGEMTPESTAEQGRLGLLALQPADFARLTDLNRRYQDRFGFPFVVALRLHSSLASVFRALETRLTHAPSTELPIALQQVCEVMRGRLSRAVIDDAQASPPVQSHLV